MPSSSRLSRSQSASFQQSNASDDSDYSPIDYSNPLLAPFLNISSTFFPGAPVDKSPSNIVIRSSDSVFFYVHRVRLLTASTNSFKSLCRFSSDSKGLDNVIDLPESAATLNIVLHCVYGLSCSEYAPTLQAIQVAISKMEDYGLSSDKYTTAPSPLSLTISSRIPSEPLQVYTHAASVGDDELATVASSHLLSYALSELTDEMATKMGPVYLRRLFFLQMGRKEALKRLLIPPPTAHADTKDCNGEAQKALTRAWGLATAYIAWEERADMSASFIESVMNPLGDVMTCPACKESLLSRTRELVTRWPQVKVSCSFLLINIMLIHFLSRRRSEL